MFDSKLKDIKPFADISQLSCYPKEVVLFMSGSIFCLNEMYQDAQHIWHIHMSLCLIKDQQLTVLFSHMKK